MNIKEEKINFERQESEHCLLELLNSSSSNDDSFQAFDGRESNQSWDQWPTSKRSEYQALIDSPTPNRGQRDGLSVIQTSAKSDSEFNFDDSHWTQKSKKKSKNEKSKLKFEPLPSVNASKDENIWSVTHSNIFGSGW